MDFPFGETLTRLRATAAIDPYSGEPTGSSWDSPDELAIPGCGFDPGVSTENVTSVRDAVTVQPEAYAPFGSDVLPGDRIRRELTGREYDVVGEPGDYRSPFTAWEAGMVIKLEAVSG